MKFPFFTFLILIIPLSLIATTSSINSNFNGTSIPSGNSIWFSADIQLTGSLPSTPVNIYMINGGITFTANSQNYSIVVPNAQIFFNPSASSPSTIYNGTTWLTTTTAPNSTLTFMQGVNFTVPLGGLPGGINPVTWSADFTTDTPGVGLSWKWAAAVYTSGADFTNLNNIGVWSTNSGGIQPGAPMNESSFVTGGARGGGGSNYTGSFSGSAAVVPGIATPEPVTYLILGGMFGIALLSKRLKIRKIKLS